MKTHFKKNDGFTLVELIVVIAILAILAAVAIPAYSGYIERTNKTLDETLISEVERAIQLAYYTGEISEDGWVDIGPNGAAPIFSDGENGQYANAIKNAFGGTDALALKYDGWGLGDDWSNSGFKGNEIQLMGKVESLTSVLAETIANHPEVMGERFSSYLTGLNINKDVDDPEKIADAAVLYVANNTQSVSKTDFNAIVSSSSDAGAMMNGFVNLYGSNVMGAAATYAMRTGYAEYLGQSDKIGNVTVGEDFDPSNVNQLMEAVMGSFNNLDATPESWQEYISKQANSDANAFIDVMGTVTSAEDQIVGSLGTDGCFTSQSLADMFTRYSEGYVRVRAYEKEGNFVIEASNQ